MRDVIIVGAGPGGSATARILAEKGFDVALYEKRQEIGAPKRCAEGLSLGGRERLGLEIPKRCIRQEIDGACVYAPNGKCVDSDFGKTVGYVLERKLFDKWLAEKAASAGAKVQAKTEITEILRENNEICGVKGTFCGKSFEESCKVLIAADGIESRISRMAGLNTTCRPRDTDSGVQFEMAGIEMSDPKKLYLYLGTKIAPRGYVWIFPKGENVANVGIGIYGRSDVTALEYLTRFVKNTPGLKKGSILEVNAGGIPVGDFLKEMALDNFLAVGDAAHQVNPVHGGGLYEAQYAGRIAAEVVAQAIEKKDTSKKGLEEYNRRWWAERGEALRRVEKLRSVVDNLTDEDMNFIAEHVTGENLSEFTGGSNFKLLAKVLLKRPSLMKYATSLV